MQIIYIGRKYTRLERIVMKELLYGRELLFSGAQESSRSN